MEDFLEYTFVSLGRLSQFSTVHVVIGNEACDLDSAISAIVHAYYLSQVHSDMDAIYIPVLNIPQKKFNLRTEIDFWLKACQIDSKRLIFRDMIEFDQIREDSMLRITLVDHNWMTGQDGAWNNKVVSVIDHHVNERPPSDKLADVNIEMVGSCCTLVADACLSNDIFRTSPQIANLLYGPILLDTINLSDEGGRKTEKDIEVISTMERLYPQLNRDKTYTSLQKSRFDLTGLSNSELLTRDMKLANSRVMNIAVSSITMSMEALLKRTRLRSDIAKFCKLHDVDVSLILTIHYQESNNTPRRALLLYCYNDVIRQIVIGALQAAEKPSLNLSPLPCKIDHIDVFAQGTSTASRKQILPIIKDFLKTEPDVAHLLEDNECRSDIEDSDVSGEEDDSPTQQDTDVADNNNLSTVEKDFSEPKSTSDDGENSDESQPILDAATNENASGSHDQSAVDIVTNESVTESHDQTGDNIVTNDFVLSESHGVGTESASNENVLPESHLSDSLNDSLDIQDSQDSKAHLSVESLTRNDISSESLETRGSSDAEEETTADLFGDLVKAKDSVEAEADTTADLLGDLNEERDSSHAEADTTADLLGDLNETKGSSDAEADTTDDLLGDLNETKSSSDAEADTTADLLGDFGSSPVLGPATDVSSSEMFSDLLSSDSLIGAESETQKVVDTSGDIDPFSSQTQLPDDHQSNDIFGLGLSSDNTNKVNDDSVKTDDFIGESSQTTDVNDLDPFGLGLPPVASNAENVDVGETEHVENEETSDLLNPEAGPPPTTTEPGDGESVSADSIESHPSEPPAFVISQTDEVASDSHNEHKDVMEDFDPFSSAHGSPVVLSGYSTPTRRPDSEDPMSQNNSYPATPPSSYVETSMANYGRETILPSFNNSEMVQRIKEKKDKLEISVSMDEEAQQKFLHLDEDPAIPFTPSSSFQEMSNMPTKETNLPSFMNSEMVQRIHERRGELDGNKEDETANDPYPFTPRNSFSEGTIDEFRERRKNREDPLFNSNPDEFVRLVHDKKDSLERDLEGFYLDEEEERQSVEQSEQNLSADMPTDSNVKDLVDESLTEGEKAEKSFDNSSDSSPKDVRPEGQETGDTDKVTESPSVEQQAVEELAGDMVAEIKNQEESLAASEEGDIKKSLEDSSKQNAVENVGETDGEIKSDNEVIVSSEEEDTKQSRDTSKDAVENLEKDDSSSDVDDVTKSTLLEQSAVEVSVDETEKEIKSEKDDEVMTSSESSTNSEIQHVADSLTHVIIDRALDAFPVEMTESVEEKDDPSTQEEKQGMGEFGDVEEFGKVVESITVAEHPVGSDEIPVETDYLSSVDPLKGQLDIGYTDKQTFATDAVKDVAESTSFDQLRAESAEELKLKTDLSLTSEKEDTVSSDLPAVEEISMVADTAPALNSEIVDEAGKSSSSEEHQSDEEIVASTITEPRGEDKEIVAKEEEIQPALSTTENVESDLNADVSADTAEEEQSSVPTTKPPGVAEEAPDDVSFEQDNLRVATSSPQPASPMMQADIFAVETPTDFGSPIKEKLTDEVEADERQRSSEGQMVDVDLGQREEAEGAEADQTSRTGSLSSDDVTLNEITQEILEEDDGKPVRPQTLDASGGAIPKKMIHPNLEMLDDDQSYVSNDLNATDILEMVEGMKTPDDLETPDLDSSVFRGISIEDDSPTKDYVEPIPEYSAKEELENERHWRAVTIAGKQYRVDMKVIEPYKKVLSHGGYYDGFNAIVVFAACYMPDRRRKDYHYVMDNLFLYVISTLELLVVDNYMIIYFHGATPKRQMPGLSWLKKCYQYIDRRLRKNLKKLYLVHPTMWLKTVMFLSKPFISSKFYHKVRYISNLSVLSKEVNLEYVYIPEEIRNIDHSIEKSGSQ